MGSQSQSQSIDQFFAADAASPDADWRSLLHNFDSIPDTGLGIEDSAAVEPSVSGKRSREESVGGSKSKACREKIRRDKLNDRFMELSSVVHPSKPPKADKASILNDAALLLTQLRSEAQELKDSNDTLKQTIKELKVEKNELRDEKIKLKLERERLEQQIKTMSAPTAGLMPTPIAFHPSAGPAAFTPCFQAPSNKAGSYPAFPQMAMWQWLPPAIVDTSKDTHLWPPNA